MVDNSRVYKPKHTGTDAKSMIKALQLVAQQAWIPLTTLSLSTATHTHWLHSTAIKFHVDKQVCSAVVNGILKRPKVTYLSIDYLLCEHRTHKQYKTIKSIIAGLPQLQTLTINNTRHTSILMNVKIGRLLSMIPQTCTTVNLIYAYRAKYNGTLLTHTVPDHIKVLTARNVQLALTPDSQLTTLHLDSCDNSNTLRLPTTLKELYVMNSIQLPVLPSKLSVLDLSKSGITEGLSGLIPDTVQTLKLPDDYTDTIGILPVALVYLDLGYKYKHQIEQLPSTLKHFSLKRQADCDRGLYRHSLDGVLPNGLEVLRVSSLRHPLGVLPFELKKLYYSCCEHSLGVLPSTLKVLQIDSMGFNSSLGQLSEALYELNLSRAYAFDKPLETLPNILKQLYLHINYQQPLVGGSSTMVCIRQSIDNHDTVRAQLVAAAAIVAPVNPFQELLAQLNVPYVDMGETDSDDDFIILREHGNDPPKWRRSFTNTNAFYY
eukprot:20425-Heterococcus_DN1.PRE.1